VLPAEECSQRCEAVIWRGGEEIAVKAGYLQATEIIPGVVPPKTVNRGSNCK